MRKTILAASAVLFLATAAGAQQQPAPQPAEPAAPSQQDPSGTPSIQRISIVDIEQLPEATKTQVNAVVAKRSDADLQKLRGSIDATPAVKSALEAQGMSSAQVIAASLTDDGTLTLITRKKAG